MDEATIRQMDPKQKQAWDKFIGYLAGLVKAEAEDAAPGQTKDSTNQQEE